MCKLDHLCLGPNQAGPHRKFIDHLEMGEKRKKKRMMNMMLFNTMSKQSRILLNLQYQKISVTTYLTTPLEITIAKKVIVNNCSLCVCIVYDCNRLSLSCVYLDAHIYI